MQGLRRNLLPILIGVAAVLVSIASVTVVVDHFREGRRFAHRFEGRFDGRGGMMRPGQFGSDGFGMPGGRMAPGQMMPGQMMPGGQGGYPGMMPGARQQQRPLLGVTGSEDQGGVRVQQVQPGSPAERAGVKSGDLIVRADGKDTSSVEALRSAVGSVEASRQQYDLVVQRDGNDQTLKVDAPRQVRTQPRQPSSAPQEAVRPGA